LGAGPPRHALERAQGEGKKGKRVGKTVEYPGLTRPACVTRLKAFVRRNGKKLGGS